MRSPAPQRGVSLVDVLVGSALFLVIFLGLFSIIRVSLAVATLAKLKSTATTIANTGIEYVRSLPYASVGTVGGIPAGIIPQYATTTQDNVSYVTRTYIEYADDPADGSGANDTNGITTDYKRVKVTTTYVANNATRTVTIVSNVVPSGIETTTGGGTLEATVVNAGGTPVPGASVRIVNASTTPAVDVTTFSSDVGVVYLPGAVPSTQYQIYVSKDGYSSAQTYARDSTNANPTPGYLTVTQGHTTALTFAIDVLGSLTVRTFTPIAPARLFDPFADASMLASLSGAAVAGGALTLSGVPGAYPANGEALSTTTAPAYLASWSNASSTTSLPAGTNALFSVIDASGQLLPDAVLPGNAAGFSGAVDLSAVSTTTYPALALRATLSTGNPNAAPSMLEWGIGYTAGPMPLPNVSFTLTGAKTKGSTSLGAAIYKTVVATTTDASGVRTLGLEWDSYQRAVAGHTVVTEDPAAPYELLPGAAVGATIVVSP